MWSSQKCHCLAVEQREANSTGNSARKIQNIVKRANTEQAMEQTASMTNNTHLRDGENVAAAHAQQPKRSSRPPTWRNRTISRRKCTHTCLASYFCNTRTCSNDSQTASPFNTKDEQQEGQGLMASALRTSSKVGKREELCHTQFTKTAVVH